MIFSIILNIVLAVALLVAVVKWPKVIEISDDEPEIKNETNGWLKLQNEGKKYIKYENGKVKLKIVK